MEENKSGRGRRGVATGGGNADEICVETQTAGPVIHRRLYQNLITSEAKATPERGERKRERESEHARAKPPPKSRRRRGLLEVVICISPLDHPCLAVDDPPLSKPRFSHTATALRVPLDVCLYLRKDFCAYTYLILRTRLRVKLSRVLYN